MAALLAHAEVDRALGGLPGWRRDGDTLVRDVEVADFLAAVDLVNRVAPVAEAAGHHPDVLIHGYRHVRLTLATHSAGGLTQLDLDLAAALAAEVGG